METAPALGAGAIYLTLDERELRSKRLARPPTARSGAIELTDKDSSRPCGCPINLRSRAPLIRGDKPWLFRQPPRSCSTNLRAVASRHLSTTCALRQIDNCQSEA